MVLASVAYRGGNDGIQLVLIRHTALRLLSKHSTDKCRFRRQIPDSDWANWSAREDAAGVGTAEIGMSKPGVERSVKSAVSTETR
jgi:hypothetical protein